MLKELEGLALGCIFRVGTCSAYQVRQLLKNSPSSHWQGSAGSIYPLLERLEREGLINGQDDTGDGRARRTLSISATGKKALRAWVKAGASGDLITQISDPVRTRIFFLDVLTPRERAGFAEDALAALEEFLDICQNDLDAREDSDSALDRLGALGAVMSNRARVAYLTEVVKALKR